MSTNPNFTPPPGWPAMSIQQAHALLTAPGTPLEMDEIVIRGIKTRVWKNLPPTLRELLAAARAAHGKKEFLVYEDDRATYESWYRAAVAIANELLKQGVKKGDRVAIIMRNIPEWPAIFFAIAGLSLEHIGWLAAIYPAVWGVGQLLAGALSDRVGRKWLIASGMWVQAAGIVWIVLSERLPGFTTGAALLGAGTAMVYPTLLAAIGDVAHPSWRASAVGVYRLWRDLGYAVGALLAGVTADVLGIQAAIWLVAE